MQIPNLPTDNLYKFMALTGLLLMLLCGYMLKYSTDLLLFYLGIFILGFLFSLCGFTLWYKRTQKHQDSILKNQANKLLEERSIFVHSKQFEKEFEVYQELWKGLVRLLIATKELRPVFKIYSSNESYEENRKKVVDVFINSYNSCIEIYEYNKPFYPENIYTEIEDIIKFANIEIIEFLISNEKLTDDVNQKGKENIDKIVQKIDSICTKIRERIGILKVNEFS